MLRVLSFADKPRILEHLIDLDMDDRRLRFCITVGNNLIAQYVDSIRSQDTLLGIEIDHKIVAFGHLARLASGRVEFGVSVNADHRGKGYATQIFNAAIQQPNISELVMHCLPYNKAMRKIAANAGMQITSKEGDFTAVKPFVNRPS